jgi:acetolactate synthase I/II/III large subunit
MAMLTGGQALVQQLKREGVDTVFVLPGVQLDWAFDALYEERDHFRVIHTRHEQACAYMADGYARASGRPGVCLVVPGPGLLNATAALSTAYACSSPVLCVTGQIDSSQIGKGRGLLHEVNDQLGLISHLTKWQALAVKPAEIPSLVHEAFRQLRTGRPRPVELEAPPDVLEAKDEVKLLPPAEPAPAEPDLDRIEAAAKLLGDAQRPVICSGGGVISSGACAELQRLAELLEAPVIMSNNGKGALSDRHHLGLPMRAMRELAPEADAVLLVGTRFVQGIMNLTPQDWMKDGKTIVRMDIDAEEIARGYEPAVSIVADARRGLDALSERVEAHNRRRDSRREELLALKEYLAEDAMRQQPQAAYAMAVRRALPDDGILVQESTQVGYWASAAFPVYEPRTFLTSGYQGTLGYGFATALGAQVAMPDRRVVSINGDGGFFYNVQELSTMEQHGIPLIAVVFNDNAYGNVKRIQETRFGGRTIASDLHNPDMLKLAEAYGVEGRRATSPEALEATLREVLRRDNPVLIEAPVGPMPQMRFTPRG